MLIGSALSLLSFLGRGDTALQDVRDAFAEDYQETGAFRRVMSGYLEDFLTMAVDGPVSYGGYTYSNEVVAEGAFEKNAYLFWGRNGVAQRSEDTEVGNPSNEDYREYAANLHRSYKNDKNLLYTVSYENSVKYTNAEGLTLNGVTGELPEGYNFLFYFDGEKATAVKDGKMLDLYGDSVYREGNDWYIPGYKNFKADGTTAKATVCMAAAAEPIIYVQGDYKEGHWQSNQLYSLVRDLKYNRNTYLFTVVGFVLGLALLVLGIVMRKSRRYALQSVARVTGKIWIEAKVLILLAALGLFVGQFLYLNNGELLYLLFHEGVFNLSLLLYDFWVLRDMSGTVILTFWIIYFFINDLRRNRGSGHNSLLRKLSAVMRQGERKLPFQKRMNRTFLWALAGVFAVMLAIFVIFVSLDPGNGLLLFCMILLVLMPLAILAAAAWRNGNMIRDIDLLTDQIAAVRNGNLTVPLNLPADADLLEASHNLSDIQRGMHTALEEQIRSERMKVELIANVSHDIKTPLTSIVSYVDLLKQEPDLPEQVRDYIKILDSKSQRLKTMVQDVFEVSKATSGQLPVVMEQLDLGKLLRQTLADMGEQITSSPYTVKAEIPEEPVFIYADGQRLYRVFQNLLQNALKYSLEGSRIHISLRADGRTAFASVKNTSRTEIPAGVDFTERFVRGDQSRTDGGSGLGLSIANSFTEACGGRFHVEAIADLFVATVEFAQLPVGETQS